MYQAVFIIGGILLEPYLARLTRLLKINTEAFSWRLFQIIRTFILIVIGRFFSRGASFAAALWMMRHSLDLNPGILFNGGIFTLGLTANDFILLGFCLVLWIAVSAIQECGYSVRELIARQNMVFRWLIYLTGAFSIVLFGIYGMGYDAQSFIYRGF